MTIATSEHQSVGIHGRQTQQTTSAKLNAEMKGQRKYKPQKIAYLHRLKGNYTLKLSSLFWGCQIVKNGRPPPYAQGHIGGEPEPSKPFSEDGQKVV
ncbi:hypothetical protein AVEN_34737-1 [Araneus ventricosus]|uniref:Uncharacterized protein n=1 Tax=Araneus ventricosus TaxID=182803 RepID=A0A4Y2GTF2_ARAVE|nr:hypothetical protein AVEN_34737-1 [Araneus ventricosus]